MPGSHDSGRQRLWPEPDGPDSDDDMLLSPRLPALLTPELAPAPAQYQDAQPPELSLYSDSIPHGRAAEAQHAEGATKVRCAPNTSSACASES